MQKVFVYGTLKRGGTNYGAMLQAGGEFLTNATLTGAQMFNLGFYPAVQRTEEADALVTGELFHVPGENILGGLDRLEGHPNFYHREEAEVTDAAGDTQKAWVYFFPHTLEPDRRIPSGTWRIPEWRIPGED